MLKRILGGLGILVASVAAGWYLNGIWNRKESEKRQQLKESKWNNCGYCNEEGHETKACPKFAPFKKLCTKHSYVAKELQVNDMLGCCAAGILPFYRHPDGKVRIVVAVEERDNRYLFNFFGGKRETSSEVPLGIAAREFFEETTDIDGKSLLTKETLRRLETQKGNILWAGTCKYALYPLEIDATQVALFSKKTYFDEITAIAVIGKDQHPPVAWHAFAHDMLTAMISITGSLEAFLMPETVDPPKTSA